jgi:hypothetical protein
MSEDKTKVEKAYEQFSRAIEQRDIDYWRDEWLKSANAEIVELRKTVNKLRTTVNELQTSVASDGPFYVPPQR